MKPLDLNTLLYVVGSISLLFGFLMLLYHRLTPTINGPLQWALGSFCVVIGSFLFAGYPVIPGYFAFVIGGTVTVMSISYYLAGIQLYRKRKINYIYFYVLIVAEFILSNFFYLVVPNPHWRMATFSLICVLGSILVIVELLKPAKKDFRLAFILVSVVFGISAFTSLYRALAVLILRPAEAHVPISANLAFYFFASISQALLMFSFLLLISLKIAERLEMKVEVQRKFFSVIAHDLSGPVGTLMQFLELANHNKNLNEENRNMIYHEAHKLSESTYHLLQNLLFWSRNQLDGLKPKIQKIELNHVILETVEILHHISDAKGVSMAYESQQSVYCMGDERMIETIIRNLVSNAIKYTNSGGRVSISCEKAEQFVLIKIADNGVGMSEKVQNNLFRFNDSVTKPGTGGEKGTGLGLYLCKEFIEENNGSMVIRSQVNVGTEVVVSLPA